MCKSISLNKILYKSNNFLHYSYYRCLKTKNKIKGKKIITKDKNK